MRSNGSKDEGRGEHSEGECLGGERRERTKKRTEVGIVIQVCGEKRISGLNRQSPACDYIHHTNLCYKRLGIIQNII